MRIPKAIVFDSTRIRGCYIAFKDDKCFYIGKTDNICHRMGRHHIKELRGFDGVDFCLFIPMPELDDRELDEVERRLIFHLSPSANTNRAISSFLRKCGVDEKWIKGDRGDARNVDIDGQMELPT